MHVYAAYDAKLVGAGVLGQDNWVQGEAFEVWSALRKSALPSGEYNGLLSIVLPAWRRPKRDFRKQP